MKTVESQKNCHLHTESCILDVSRFESVVLWGRMTIEPKRFNVALTKPQNHMPCIRYLNLKFPTRKEKQWKKQERMWKEDAQNLWNDTNSKINQGGGTIGGKRSHIHERTTNFYQDQQEHLMTCFSVSFYFSSCFSVKLSSKTS